MSTQGIPLEVGLTTSLRSKVRTGLLWTAIQSWGGRLSILGLFMIMTRVLAPADIGLFAMASVVLALLTMLADQGLAEAVVQRKEISQEQMNTVFWLNMAVSLLITAVLWFTAPLVARQLDMPDLAPILRTLVLSLPITAASFGQMSMRKRAFEYRHIAMVTLTATVTGCLIAAGLVLAGFGVWSLVAQTIITTTLLTILLWIKPNWRPGRETDLRNTLPLMRYGASRISTAILDFANTRYIEFFLAAALGPATLAIYAVGVRLYQALMQALGSTVYEVAHNGFSRLADDRPALINAYYKSQTATAAVAVPVFCLLVAVASPLTITLFGERWHESATVTRVMCVLGAIQLLQFYNGTIYNAMGKPNIGLKFMVLKVVLTFTGFYLARNGNLNTLLFAYFMSQIITTPLSFYVVKRLVNVSLRELVRRLWPFLCASILMAGAAYGVLLLLEARHLPPLATLIASCAVGAAVYVGSVQLFAPTSLRSAWAMLKSPTK